MNLLKECYISRETGEVMSGEQVQDLYYSILDHPDFMDLGFPQFVGDGFELI